jgi:ferredoxin
MIVAEIKPFGEIKDMLKDYNKIFVIGCGTCVTVCLSGGERQVELLASNHHWGADNIPTMRSRVC